MTRGPHRPRRAHAAVVLATSLALTLGSCCNLAMLLCGPDKSHWVRIGYETPEAALATFMEAVRRDNTEVIYESLSSSFKANWHLPGELEATIAWERMKEQFSGIHLLGTASVGEPVPIGTAGTRLRYELTVSSHRFHVDLVRVAMAQVGFELGAYRGVNGYPLDSLDGLVTLRRDDLEATAVLTIGKLDDLPDDVRATDIVEARASYQWKLGALGPVPEG